MNDRVSVSYRMIIAELLFDIGGQCVDLCLLATLVFSAPHADDTLFFLLAVQQIPAMVLARIIGGWVDAVGPKRALVWSCLAKCLCILGIIAVETSLMFWGLYMGLMISSLVFLIARLTITPGIIKPDRLVAYNALNERTALAWGMVSPGLIGAVIKVTGTTTTLIGGAGFLILSGLLVLGLPKTGGHPMPADDPQAVADGLQAVPGVVQDTGQVAPYFALTGIAMLGSGFIGYGGVLMAGTCLGGDIALWGILMSGHQAGACLATLLLPYLAKRFPNRRLIPWCAGGLGTGFVLLATIRWMPVFMGVMTVFGFGFTFLAILLESRIQRNSEQVRTGKLMANLAALRGAAMFTGLLCGVGIARMGGVRCLMAAGGLVMFGGGIFSGIAGLPDRRAVPERYPSPMVNRICTYGPIGVNMYPTMLNKLKYSIITRVSLFVTGMVLLGAAMSSLILATFSWQEFQNTIRRDYKAILKSSGSEISTYLIEAQNAMESLGAIMAYTRPAPDAWKKEVALTAFSHQNPRFSKVFLVDARTRRVLTTDSGTADPVTGDSPFHLKPFMEKALSGDTIFSKVYHNDYGMPYVSIAVPIKRLGAVDELLCGELNLKLLWEVLEGIRIGATGYISVLDDKGQYIGHREIVPVLKRLTTDRLEALAEIESTDTVADWLDLKAGNLCMAFHIPDIDWYILLNQPLHELYGHIRKSLLWVIILTSAVCLGGILMSRWWSRRLLRPLKDLHRQAMVIGQGNFDQRIEHVSPDEIGELAKEFNDMTASLQTVLAERVKMEKDIAHTRNLAVLGKAAGKLNHEVGNLLNNMGLFIRLLKEKPVDEKDYRLVTILEKDLDRARNFVQTCLKLAKRPEIRKAPLALDTVVEEALVAHRTVATERGIEITTTWAEDLPKAFLDGNMIHQVIQNLVKNSLDALGDGNGRGRIRLSGHAENGTLCLSVADNGPGIPADRMEKIFEPFFTTKGDAGTGFGLVIVREIVVAHGGRIECASPPGEGVEFRLYFPVG